MAQTVTMKDIAERAGVSRATVGFVLSDNPPVRIREETRQRVLMVAAKLGYRPNSSARAMRSGRFGSVALLLSTVRSLSLTPTELLDGVHDTLAANDLHLVVTKIPDEKLSNAGFVPKILRELSSDGLIVNYNSDFPQAFAKLIRDCAIPAIWVNSRHESDCVFPDDVMAGKEATEHLIALGHRRIAYVDYTGTSHHSTFDRQLGYQTAMKTAGFKDEVYRVSRLRNFDQRIPEARELLARSDRPTAIVAYNDHIVAPVMAAASILSVRVPEDLSLISFDSAMTRQFGRLVDTMVLPQFRMGKAAVEMLLAKIATPDTMHPPCSVPLSYLAGQTLAPLL